VEAGALRWEQVQENVLKKNFSHDIDVSPRIPEPLPMVKPKGSPSGSILRR
jgi:hypothetical protein